MRRPDFSLKQCERLHRLISGDCSALTRTQVRRLRMIAGLVGGVAPGEVANVLEVKPSTISNLKNQIAGAGLNAVLGKMENAIARANAAASRSRGIPGPAGINTVDEWLETVDVDREPIMEIAEMVIEPGANIAVLAVRDRKKELLERMVGAATYTSTVRRIVARPALQEVHWTRLSCFDHCVASLLEKLAAKHRDMEESGTAFSWRNDFPTAFTALREKFGPDYDFLILAQGDVAERNVRQWHQSAKAGSADTAAGDPIFVSSAAEFFDRLASTIYRLRERWSCPGLLPLHWNLRGLVELWAETDEPQPFLYQCNFEFLQNSLESAALLWRYTAFYGALFHMSRSMWSRLPWNSEFLLDVTGVRPRIEIPPITEDQRGLPIGLRILPGVGYEFHSFPEEPVLVNPEDLSQELRGFLRDKGAAARFFYSNIPKSFAGWEQVIRPDRAEESPQGFDRIPAVLIPRHFVATDEGVDLAAVCAMAENLGEGIFRLNAEIDGVSEPSLAFHAPELLAAIRRAYEANTYGDEMHSLGLHLRRTAEHIGSMDDGQHWKYLSVFRLSHYRPSYWCLDPATQGKEGPNKWRWDVLMALQKSAQDSGNPFNFMPPGNDSIERGFKEVLHDCDADFLLRGFSTEDRDYLNNLTDAWEQRVNALIAPLYNVDDSGGKSRVIAVVINGLKKQAGDRVNELRSWVYDALVVFSRNNRRVDRKAIEIAQRCSLAGVKPYAFVMESELSILRRWRAFLRARLKSHLIPRGKPSAEPEAVESQKTEAESIGSDREIAPDDYDPLLSTQIGDLADLVFALIRTPRDSNLARNFALEAVEIERSVLRGVLEMIEEEVDAAMIKSAVLKGLQICRGQAPGTESLASKIDALMDLFDNLNQQAKPDVKGRKRP